MSQLQAEPSHEPPKGKISWLQMPT